MLTHLPRWLHCASLNCRWRGDRVNVFKAHWSQKHIGDTTPPLTEFAVYDGPALVDRINEGAISAIEAVGQALDRVHERANRLQKQSLSKYPWGRR